MKFFLSVILICVFSLRCNAQKINHIINDKENAIEFRTADNTILKKINVNERSRYTRLSYASTLEGDRVRYNISQTNVSSVLNSFFIRKNDKIKDLKPSSMVATSEVAPQNKYVIISDHLTLYGLGGILGVKSTATVYNELGEVVATLPENNDGYFAPSVTENGKYFATLYGDVTPHTEQTALPQPGFRLYDLKTGLRIVDIAANNFDVYPTSAYGNIIVEIFRDASGQYEYLFFDTNKRIVFKRKFSGSEVDQFLRFNDDGIIVRVGLNEKLISFKSEFTSSNF